MGIEALKQETIIIFISGLNLHKTPPLVQKAIASDEAAGPTPIIAVFDAKIERLAGVVPYFDMKDINGFSAVRTSLGKIRGIAFEPQITQYPSETWNDFRGRSFEGTYVTSTPEFVTLRLSNGKLSTIAIEKMSDPSRKRIKEILDKKQSGDQTARL